jgi:hypothetical protein
MLIVIVGSEGAALDAVIAEFHRVGDSRVQSFSLGYLTDPMARLSRLNLETNKPAFRGTVKVITGIENNTELELLRGRGAMIGHVYGAMGAIYRHITINADDLFVSKSGIRLPDHVFTPEQFLSECEIRRIAALTAIRQPINANTVA